MNIIRPQNADQFTNTEIKEFDHREKLTLGGVALIAIGWVGLTAGVATGSSELLYGGTAGIVAGTLFTRHEHEKLVEIDFKAGLRTLPLENPDVI